MGRRRHTTQRAAREDKFSYAGRCMTTGKVIFVSRRAAKQNREYYKDAGSRPYRCQHCNGIHLGHAGGYDRQQHREWNASSTANEAMASVIASKVSYR